MASIELPKGRARLEVASTRSNLVAGLIILAALGAGLMGMAALGLRRARPSEARVDWRDVQGLTAAVEASARGLPAAEANDEAIPVIDPAKLEGLLPDRIAGMARSHARAARAGAGGMASSRAEAVYSKGAERVTLKVTDLAAMGPMAAMAGAIGLQSGQATPKGYEKTSRVDGKLVVEKWDRASLSGEYTLIVGQRFAVEASGVAPTIDDLKAVVAAVRTDRLEGMVKA